MKTIEGEAIDVILDQTDKGIEKYGFQLDDADLSTGELIDHAREECADLLMYLTALKRKLNERS